MLVVIYSKFLKKSKGFRVIQQLNSRRLCKFGIIYLECMLIETPLGSMMIIAIAQMHSEQAVRVVRPFGKKVFTY